MPVKELMKRLHLHLEYMSDLAERQVDTAVMALVDGNEQLAGEALAAEEEMDAMDLQVNKLAHEALETLGLAGADFRYVIAAMRASGSLERIGNLAADTARQARRLCGDGPAAAGQEMAALVEEAETLVRDAVAALVAGDTATAWTLIEREGSTAALRDRTIDAIEKAVEEKRVHPQRAVYLMLAAVDLGRIGEHATSIAEEVIYLMENRLIKHVGRMMLEARKGKGASEK